MQQLPILASMTFKKTVTVQNPSQRPEIRNTGELLFEGAVVWVPAIKYVGPLSMVLTGHKEELEPSET